MDLKGKIAFVTGGSGDIGGAIARALAAAGADVAISYVGAQDKATETMNAVRAHARRSLAVQLDQRDPASIDAAAKKLVDEFGRADILVNNAAWNIGIPFKNLDPLTAEVWDRVLETNLRGPFMLSRALDPQLRANRQGRIVNIASTGGIYPGSSSIAYSSSKAGLIHLTRCLAVALGPDVTVNCIAPGLVEGTRMAQRVPQEVVDGALKQVVLGRCGSAQDIADQVDSVTAENTPGIWQIDLVFEKASGEFTFTLERDTIP